jgi:hypothetical protein
MPDPAVQDLYDKTFQRIGRLAERANDPVLTPNESDYDLFDDFLSDGLSELSTRTRRLRDTVTRTVAEGKKSIDDLGHVHQVLKATVTATGTETELDVMDGYEVAQLAQDVDPQTGRPNCIGEHAGKYWLYPIPEQEYELTLYAQRNGMMGPSESLADLVEAVPAELMAGLSYYLVAEWMLWDSNPELSRVARTRFERALGRHKSPPNSQTTATSSYNPLSL